MQRLSKLMVTLVLFFISSFSIASNSNKTPVESTVYTYAVQSIEAKNILGILEPTRDYIHDSGVSEYIISAVDMIKSSDKTVIYRVMILAKDLSGKISKMKIYFSENGLRISLLIKIKDP